MLGAPLSCLSVLIPHPAGAVWAPWPGAAPRCQALLVLAVPRVMQHFFPEPLGNRLAFFPFPRCFGWGGDGWVAMGAGSPAGHCASQWHYRQQDGREGSRNPCVQDSSSGCGQDTHSELPDAVPVVHPPRGSLTCSAARGQWECGAGGCRTPRSHTALPGTGTHPGMASVPW